MKQLWTDTKNLILFVIIALWRGTPFRLWSHAWHEVKAAHLAETRKAIWELKKQGKIREDSEGRLWSVREENQ